VTSASVGNVARMTGAYRVLLRAYPAAFRERFGRGMTQAFARFLSADPQSPASRRLFTLSRAMLMQAMLTAASMNTESSRLWTYNIQLKGFRILLYGIAFVLPLVNWPARCFVPVRS